MTKLEISNFEINSIFRTVDIYREEMNYILEINKMLFPSPLPGLYKVKRSNSDFRKMSKTTRGSSFSL